MRGPDHGNPGRNLKRQANHSNPDLNPERSNRSVHSRNNGRRHNNRILDRGNPTEGMKKDRIEGRELKFHPTMIRQSSRERRERR